MPIMDTTHPDWTIFLEKLEGPEGCHFHYKKPGNASSITWKCHGDLRIARRILRRYWPGCDVIGTCAWLIEHDGGCDCEILFNVAEPDETDVGGGSHG